MVHPPEADGLLPEEPHERSREFNQSVQRGLMIIETFGPDASHQTVSEVAAKTNLTRATARRFLLTLVRLGYLTSDGRTFQLSPRVLRLGYSYLSGLRVPSVALPHLEALVAEVDEASEASILDGHDVVYVVRVPGTRLMRVAVNVGSRMPAHATSMGRVLLAGLPDDALERYLASARMERASPHVLPDRETLREQILEARVADFAILNPELEEGLIAVAVPLHDRMHRVIAAVNLSTTIGRHDPSSVRHELLPALRRHAALIERDLATAA